MRGAHTRTVGGARHVWRVDDLVAAAAGLPVTNEDPRALIDLDRDGWFGAEAPTARRVLEHMRRVLDADLAHPVILDADGSLMDGAHRVCKAILLGLPTLPAVRFPATPPPSSIEPL